MNKKLIYIFLITIWIVIFFSLTPIILKITSKSISSSFYDVKDCCDMVYYNIEKFSISNNLTVDTFVSGWAFLETDEGNDEKIVKMILSSDELTYEIEMKLGDRKDVSSFFKDSKVPLHRTGISTTFSPLNLKNGNYTLYIYVYENENAFGIINTKKVFLKNNHNFKEIFSGDNLPITEFSKAKPNKEIQYHIEKNELGNNNILITGWAFIYNFDADRNQIYLEITKPDGVQNVYNTNKVTRKDVSDHFQDEKYKMSGFSALLPLDAFGEGENKISIIIGKESRSVDYYIFSLNEGIINKD